MTEYKCPYCGQNSYAKSSKKSGKFPNWASVSRHLPKCIRNNNTFTIDRIKGPRKLQTKIYWSKELILQKIHEFYKLHSKIPQKRDFTYTDGKYPDQVTVQKYFGSWNRAIEAAGFTPNIQNGFGIDTYAKDGKLYRSTYEAHFVNNFLFEKEDYEYEKPYGNGWYFDFYLPKYNLYIELDGGLRPQRIQEKIEFCKRNNINLKVIKTSKISLSLNIERPAVARSINE